MLGNQWPQLAKEMEKQENNEQRVEFPRSLIEASEGFLFIWAE